MGDGAASSTCLPGALGQIQGNLGEKRDGKSGKQGFPEALKAHHRLAPRPYRRVSVPARTISAEHSVGLLSAMGCLQGAVFGSCCSRPKSASSFAFQERVEAHVHSHPPTHLMKQ